MKIFLHITESNAEVSCDSMVAQVYDPPPSYAYVCLLEAKLARTIEALA